MNKTVKLILNIVVVILYGVAFISFFTDFIYVWVLRAGVLGSYKGYELALNFDGMPQNLGTLFPLLMVLGIFVFSIIALFKKIITFKKAPKRKNGKTIKPLLCAIFFVLFPLITFFLSLSTFYILGLPAPKKYGGYYMSVGPYLVAYFSLIGGLILFLIQCGIFDKEIKEPVVEEKKEEVKPTPKAAPQVAVTKPAQPVRPAPTRPVGQQATVVGQTSVRTAQPRPAAPQPARPGVAKPAQQDKPTTQDKK